MFNVCFHCEIFDGVPLQTSVHILYIYLAHATRKLSIQLHIFPADCIHTISNVFIFKIYCLNSWHNGSICNVLFYKGIVIKHDVEAPNGFVLFM